MNLPNSKEDFIKWILRYPDVESNLERAVSDDLGKFNEWFLSNYSWLIKEIDINLFKSSGEPGEYVIGIFVGNCLISVVATHSKWYSRYVQVYKSYLQDCNKSRL